MAKRERLVYSTDGDNTCSSCGKPRSRCRCASTPSAPVRAGDGVVRVGRATQGRRGKPVTTVTGLPVAGDEAKRLLKRLKQTLGTGGTLKGEVLEIQGDHRDRLVALLQEEGWTVKRSGG